MATNHPKMDRKLVAKMEPYEVRYLAQKFKVSAKTVRAAVQAVGRSRTKVERELRRVIAERADVA